MTRNHYHEIGTDPQKERMRRRTSNTLDRECPDCGQETTHIFYGRYPAVATSGAWGKYLNPVYLCSTCKRTHTLLVYETPDTYDQPKWGEYPPNDPTVNGPATAHKLVNMKAKMRARDDDASA